MVRNNDLHITAPRGISITCKGWHQEAALRMLLNNIEQGADPANLIIYGGTGRAARNWDAFNAIKKCLVDLENDETLLIQSGKPVGVFKTHEYSPRVLIANSLIVPHWDTDDRCSAEPTRTSRTSNPPTTRNRFMYPSFSGINTD